jgi:hypothetical protein
MDTPSEVIPLDPHAHSEPSGDLHSGNLDSGFLCELNGVETAFPHKSSNLAPDLSESDEPAVGADGVEAQRTNIPLHKQGKIKTWMMLGLVSIPMIGVGYSMFGGSESAKTVEVPAEAAPPKPTTQDFAPDPRFAVAQSKLAMQKQEQQLLAAANDRKTTPATPQPEPVTTAPVTTAPATPVTAAPVTITDPTPTNVQPPILPAPTPTPTPAPASTPVAAKPVVTVIRPVEPVAKPVVRQIAVASRSLPAPSRYLPAPAVTVVKPAPIPAPAVKQVSWNEATAGAVVVMGARRESASPTAQVAMVQATSPTPTGRSIIAGQNRIASLITPLQLLSGEQSQEVLLNLEQGFVNTQGGMSIPANTKVVAQVTVASNGILRIGEAKATIRGLEYSIAAGNLMLVGTNNQPLLAELKQFNGGEIGKRDLQTFLIGAAQGLGKVLTQPSTQTQITAGGAAISTTDSNPNVIGGILEGGATPIAQTWAKRNEAEIQRLEGAARVWFLPAGARVSLYTTKPFEVK